MAKQVKPKLRNGRKLIRKIKAQKSPHKKKITKNSSNEIENKMSNNKGTKTKIEKVKLEVKTDEAIPTVEVIFNPAIRCIACEEGRQGEGEKNCWGCRLRRLQNIQVLMPWNRKNKE